MPSESWSPPVTPCSRRLRACGGGRTAVTRRRSLAGPNLLRPLTTRRATASFTVRLAVARRSAARRRRKGASRGEEMRSEAKRHSEVPSGNLPKLGRAERSAFTAPRNAALSARSGAALETSWDPLGWASVEAPCPWQCLRAVFNPPKPALNLAGCCHLRPIHISELLQLASRS